VTSIRRTFGDKIFGDTGTNFYRPDAILSPVQKCQRTESNQLNGWFSPSVNSKILQPSMWSISFQWSSKTSPHYCTAVTAQKQINSINHEQSVFNGEDVHKVGSNW